MTRSSHIAIVVPPDRVDEAVAHYKTLLGVTETKRSPEGVELSGPNFMLYVEPGDKPVVLQEFVTTEGAGVRSKFEAAGCQVFGESSAGFHVTDPFGLSYHVWLEEAGTPAPAPSFHF